MSSQGKVPNLPGPFIFEAAFRKQRQIVDYGTHRTGKRDFEYARHGTPCLYPLIGEAWYRFHVVGEQYPVLTGTPFENHVIIRPGKSDILYAHDVEIWIPTKQSSDNIGVEILLSGQPKHQPGLFP